MDGFKSRRKRLRTRAQFKQFGSASASASPNELSEVREESLHLESGVVIELALQIERLLATCGVKCFTFFCALDLSQCSITPCK